MVTYTTNETAALDDNIHRLRHNEFYAATEGVNLNFLILCNGGIAQVHTDAPAESVETGTMEHFATIDVLVAALVHTTTDALTVFTNGQWTLQPLIRVATITVDNETYTYIYQQTDTEIGNPRFLRYSCKPVPLDDSPNCCQLYKTGYNENYSNNRSWFHNFTF